MAGPTARRCAVIGRPIGHSLSPALHRAAYRSVGLDWSYEAVEVGAEQLPDFLDGLDASWRGISMTMPLKRTAIPLLDELTARAEQARAANTVILQDGRRTGHNTDVPGAVLAIRERYDGPLGTSTILGGGATATSAMLALADLGCTDVLLAVRDPERARQTVEAAGRHPGTPTVRVRSLDDHVPARRPDIVVSTIPAAAQTEQVLAAAEGVPVVFDVVYDPWPTPLATYAGRSGQVLVAGLDLLVHQAVLQFQLMTGRDESPVEVMRRAGEEELRRRVGNPS